MIRNELSLDLEGMLYSLIIEESTDSKTEKQLCGIVRYFSKIDKVILASFSGMISPDSGTTEGVFITLDNILLACDLKFGKCVGLVVK